MAKALRFFLAVFLVLSLDRATKLWIANRFSEGGGFSVLSGIFHITYVKNTGAAFGIFRQQLPFLILLSTVFLIIFFVYLFRRFFRESSQSQTQPFSMPLTLWAWSLIVAGAAGNLYDRIFYGYVVDFLDFRVWPVFNVADTAICVGVALIFLDSFFNKAEN